MKLFYQNGYLKKSKHFWKKIKKVYNPKTLEQIARENIKMNEKELDKDLAKKMINPYFFIDENLKNDLKINLDSHNINHANSIWSITPKFRDFGIETRYNNKIIKELSVIYARLINQYIYLNITHNFQRAFIKIMKKINEVMKLIYIIICIITIF